MYKKIHTKETREKAILLYKEGFSIDEVGKQLNCGKSSIHRWCKGLIRKGNKERIKKGRDLYLSGLSGYKVGQILGVSRSIVNVWCRDIIRKSGDSRRGANNPAWKGGITPLIDLIRESRNYHEWRNTCFKRDGYNCQIGGKEHGNKLHVHHIKSFSQIMDENHIDSFDKAMDCKELWDVTNGQTLCIKCHVATETYGWKGFNIKFESRIINKLL